MPKMRGPAVATKRKVANDKPRTGNPLTYNLLLDVVQSVGIERLVPHIAMRKTHNIVDEVARRYGLADLVYHHLLQGEGK